MDDAALTCARPLPTTCAPFCDERAPLRAALRASRRAWRWHWERFWLLRWENALRRPAWRVDEEARAWQRMRAEVRRYAELRAQIAADRFRNR